MNLDLQGCMVAHMKGPGALRFTAKKLFDGYLTRESTPC